MTELENLKSLEKYDQWKKAKRHRKTYISLIASLIGLLFGLLLAWLILKVSPKDTWTLTKGVFIKEEKIMETIPKIEEVDNKLKNSIVAKPLNFLSEKVQEETLKGNFSAITSAIRTYSIILVVIWLLVLLLIYSILYFLTQWIISRFVWKEPTLYEQKID